MCMGHAPLVMEDEVDGTKIESRYIGDGVEASFDGYHIWLKTVDGNNNQVALEPPVMKRLFEYVKYVEHACRCARDLDGQKEEL